MNKNDELATKWTKINFSLIEFGKFILYTVSFVVIFIFLRIGYYKIFFGFSLFSLNNISSASQIFASVTTLIILEFGILRKKNIMVEIPCVLFPLKFVWVIILFGFSGQLILESIVVYILPVAYNQISTDQIKGNMLFDIFFGCIYAPIFEEILFRGLVFSKFKKFIPLGAALILQAIIFGMIHGPNIAYILVASLIGILFGFLVIYFKSIVPGIIAHMTMNVCVQLYSQNNAFFETIPGWLAPLVGGVIFCSTCVIFLKKLNTKL